MNKLLASLAAVATLAGCASPTSLDSEVSTFSRWPAGRKASTYVFDRMPSQQAQPQQAQVLEDAARLAVESAGFVPAAEGSTPDFGVQVGARVTGTVSPFDDPFWYGPWGPWHRPFGYGRYYGRYGGYYGGGYGYYGRPFWGPGWGYGSWGYDRWYYEREVAVLIRDKRSGEPLYEARATSDGLSPDLAWSLPAMFQAALKDFPNGDAKPRQIRIESPRAATASAAASAPP